MVHNTDKRAQKVFCYTSAHITETVLAHDQHWEEQIIENLNPVSLQQTADLFPEHVPHGSFMLFFNAENTVLLLLRIQLYKW